MKFWTIVAFVSFLACGSWGTMDYHLNKVDNPNEDQLDAYARIATAMDSAIGLYNKYTSLSKHIEVYYNPGVPTAEASSNGSLSFGSGRSYMVVITAMHEMAHTLGMGTTNEYNSAIVGGVFQGEKAQAKLKELTGDNTAELHGDAQHFWPYGLNYASEVKSEKDLVIHAQLVEAMYQDLFKEAFYTQGRLKSVALGKCMGISSSNALSLMDCAEKGAFVKIFSVGENPVAYRIDFGSRVVDIPNESTAAGVTLGTYPWNGGAHQKFLFEMASAEKESEKILYLQNLKSKLYLEAGENSTVLQNPKGGDHFLWQLVEGEEWDDAEIMNPVEPPRDSLEETQILVKNQGRNLKYSNGFKVDVQGRQINVQSLRRFRHIKLF